jgi:ankyrin repeat protein
MANRICDVSIQQGNVGICHSIKEPVPISAHRAQSAHRAVRDDLVELFPKILEAYQNNEHEKRRNLLQQLDKKMCLQKNWKEVCQLYRSCTSFLQTQQNYWRSMETIVKLDKKIKNIEFDKSKQKTLISDINHESSCMKERDIEKVDAELSKLSQERAFAKQELFELLASIAAPVQEGVGSCDRFKPGPVGESPVHVCFLLGLADIGQEIIEQYYPGKTMISVPYKNDLLPLQTENVLVKHQQDLSSPENGLYTGETLLHIAIVNEDAVLVKRLLDQGIEISSPATGVFFQPRWLRPRIKDLSRWQRFLSWVSGVDLKVEKFAILSREVNQYSACYYGEYPLSFAASVGSVGICKLLLSCHKDRQNDPHMQAVNQLSRIGRSQTFVQHNEHWRAKADGTGRSPLWEFLNAIDFFGNTALHMAVFHRRKEVIDWLMTNEDATASLEILNFDGFTPLTYAVRLGYVDIFNHILFKYLSRTGWTYGKVS